MFRIDGPTAAPGGLFSGGDPTVPTPPTTVSPDWLNAVQEEIAGVILTAGIALAKGSNGQLYAAIEALIASGGVALASDAEAIAGTITNKATTPHSAAALVSARIAALIGGAPDPLNTLGELAAAINNDPAFANTVAAALSARALAVRQVQAAGLATGGGDLTNDRTITVPAATFADYVAGTSGAKALTPAALAQGAGSNQYGAWATLPGGAVMQWGKVVVLPSGGSSASASIIFPQPFGSACESITGNADDGTNTNWRAQTVIFPGGPTLNGSQVLIDSTDPAHSNGSARQVWWKALGR